MMNRNIVSKRDIAEAQAAVKAGTATPYQRSLLEQPGFNRNVISKRDAERAGDAVEAKTTTGLISREVMENLKGYVNSVVSVEYVLHGRKDAIMGVLANVNDFENVGIVIIPLGGPPYVAPYPFVGLSLAIRLISADGKMIYDNTKNVPEGTIIYGVEKSRELRMASFGEDALKQVEEERARTHTGVLRARELEKKRLSAFFELFKKR